MTNDQQTTAPQLDEGTDNLLKNLPNLVGAIDMAIKDTAGKPMAFMLLVFADGAALHATNTDPAAAHDATKAYLESVEQYQAKMAQEQTDAADGLAS